MIREKIKQLASDIVPLDAKEAADIAFVKTWIDSGAEIFRRAPPATPDPHLVAYCVVIDPQAKKILLTDHKKAELWLAAGGHVEPDEHPKQTAERETKEELGIEADFLSPFPLFLTVRETEGKGLLHTDVSFWYLLRADSTLPIIFDKGEFYGVQWFPIDAVPTERTDYNLHRFLRKISSLQMK